MGKVSLGVGGGVGPYTITIREVSETSGNRYTGPNPTNVLSNLDVNYIKDGLNHTYIAKVENPNCSAATSIFEKLCPCEIVPSFIATQVCTNPSDPKIAVTASLSTGDFVRIVIYNSENVVIHDIVSISGTQVFSVTNNNTYRISVFIAADGYENCKAADQVVNVSCTIPCTLTLTVSNPTC